MISTGVSRRWFLAKIAGLVALLVVLSVGVFLYVLNSVVSDNVRHAPMMARRVSGPEVISSNILILGNTFWGRYIDDWSKASPLGIAYPFSRLNEFDRGKYDAWIAGLECPTANNIDMSSAEMEQHLQFNCSPEYLPEAAKWFTAFSLANNHTDNHGAEGFAPNSSKP